MSELPLKCDCGATETKRENIEAEPGVDIVAYDLHCAECGKYLGHFEYGLWEY